MVQGLFVNSSKAQCGVYQYGREVFEAIKNLYPFAYIETGDVRQITASIQELSPSFVLYNFDPHVMSYLSSTFIQEHPGLIHIALVHELQGSAHFDYCLFADPTFRSTSERIFRLKRLIPCWERTRFSLPEIPTIGSAGMVTTNKGYEELIDLVQKEFDVARIRLHLPGKNFALEKLQKRIKKPGISLDVSHGFLSQEELLDFFAQNTINVFLYNPFAVHHLRGGLSSALDQAIAAGRPIAISPSYIFRHLLESTPSIVAQYPLKRQLCLGSFQLFKLLLKSPKSALRCLQNLLAVKKMPFQRLFLREIIAQGTSPCEKWRTEWSKESFQISFRESLDTVLQRRKNG